MRYIGSFFHGMAFAIAVIAYRIRDVFADAIERVELTISEFVHTVVPAHEFIAPLRLPKLVAFKVIGLLKRIYRESYETNGNSIDLCAAH